MFLLLHLDLTLILLEAMLRFLRLGDHSLHFIDTFLVHFQAVLDVLLGVQQALFSLMDILFDFSFLSKANCNLFFLPFCLLLHFGLKFLNLTFQIKNLRPNFWGHYRLLMLNLRNDNSLHMLKGINLILSLL